MIQRNLNDHIEITPGVCGGKPRIAGHRITVQNIAIWHERLGLSGDEIANEYGLTLADIHATLAYYFDHREAIDQSIAGDEAFIAEQRGKHPSGLKQKLIERYGDGTAD